MYLSLNELVEEIQMNIERLQNGQMDLEEVEKHVTLVRELYERTVVLKFKALELKSTVKIDTNHQEEGDVFTTVAIANDEKEIFESSEEPQADLNELTSEEVAFDLFGAMFSTDTVDVVEESVEDVDVQSLIGSEMVEEINAVDLTSFEVKDEVVSPSFSEVEQVDSQPIVEIGEQSVIETDVPKHLMVFSQKLKEVNAEASNQFGFSPLNTLIGSFGLNERLQYINELFSSSSEAFSDAVKAFDGLQDLEEANTLLLTYADTQMWDVESPAVEEFMHKLCRRYA